MCDGVVIIKCECGYCTNGGLSEGGQGVSAAVVLLGQISQEFKFAWVIRKTAMRSGFIVLVNLILMWVYIPQEMVQNGVLS